ncbi:MAG TPA: response regulator transcription factor [Microvirga sp.]
MPAVPERFLIVDDHPLFREALQSAIHLAYPDAEILEATSIESAKTVVATRKEIDLVLLDLSMPGTKGFDGLLELRTHNPRLPIVVVSGLEDGRIIREALSYGIAGFIPKSARKPELAEAICEVMSGAVYLPKDFAERQAQPASPGQVDLARRLTSLTPQQLRVLQMIRQGKLNKQIAFELDVGETTVKAHVSEILRKLNVYSRTMAVIEVSKIDFEAILAAAGETGPKGRDGS